MTSMIRVAVAGLASCLFVTAAGAAEPVRNVILFVADGLRHGIVTEQNAPTLTQVMREGVAFRNSHSIFPTFTTANASAMATGHYLGDTGDFSNTIYTGKDALTTAKGSVTPFLESDPILGEMDQRFNGNYLNEASVLALAREAGFNTATIGKLGPALIMDHASRGPESIVIDDSTGKPAGVPLPPAVQDALKAAGLGLEAPTRGANGSSGSARTPGTLSANVNQQAYFVAATTTAVLPLLKSQSKPFVLVFWSRDPDGTQHNQGDSLLQLTPGINGPTSLAAVRNVDNNLASILSALKSQGLDASTDVIVTSDHGFSTISKQSGTSPAAKASYADVPAGLLPPGFLGIDLATALQWPLFDPDRSGAAVAPGTHSAAGNALIGTDAANPSVVVAANGGSDLVYLPGEDRASMAPKVVEALLAQDYVSGVFVDDSLGSFAGTLPLSAIHLSGGAATPTPSIVVNFRSFHVDSPACPTYLTCTVEVADTALQQGQGMHGTFSRADTFNFMAAIGPSFKRGYVDRMPVSNADIGQTIASLMHLPIDSGRKGRLVGRVLEEATAGGRESRVVSGQLVSTASPTGLKTIVHYRQVGGTRYFNAAGFPGRTVGLDAAGRPDHLDDAVNRSRVASRSESPERRPTSPRPEL
ncbi:alkaline phosphatase family protein [Variovorax sp. GT1P44]|uniref:alkaline phosphatase family protein n=1 Tax=Variovorax sp. GT1P44 TaxID=3443742 RepID=UPI003F473831